MFIKAYISHKIALVDYLFFENDDVELANWQHNTHFPSTISARLYPG